MAFLLLKLVAKQMQESGIAEYLLMPDLTPEQRYSPLYEAIALAAFGRLRRERPYVNAYSEEQRPGNKYSEADDRLYVQSLPKLPMAGPNGTVLLTYVGQGDLSPFVPSSEEDFLLFLSEPPSSVLPSWPHLVVDLNGVLVGQSDEFIKLQTVDPSIAALIEALPRFMF